MRQRPRQRFLTLFTALAIGTLASACFRESRQERREDKQVEKDQKKLDKDEQKRDEH